MLRMSSWSSLEDFSGLYIFHSILALFQPYDTNLLVLTNTLLEKGTRTHYTNTLSISFLFQPTAFKLLCPLLPCSDDISTKITNDQAVKSNGNVS